MAGQQGGGQLAVTGGLSALMLPPPPRLPKRKPDVVVDEDEWTSTLEAIIERDFFPELPKLESKIAWLQAIRSGDPEQIRQAQLLIAQRRAAAGGGPRPHTGATPANAPLFTPGGTAARVIQGDTPYIPVLPPGVSVAREGQRPATGATAVGGTPAAGQGGGYAGDGGEGGDGGAQPAAAPPVSLDQFLAIHTSEDNASFQEIIDDVNKRRRMKHANLLGQQPDHKLLITDGRERTDGFGTSGQQPDTLIGWKYEPKNALYYDSSNRDVFPFSESELSAMVQGAPKAINHGATRFPKDLQPSSSATPSSSSAAAGGSAAANGLHGAAAAAAAAAGYARPGGGAGQGGMAGYDILSTPSFDPGAEETPFVTWGDIEATPMRIDAEDLPPGPHYEGGPSFYIKEGSRKEQNGHALANKAAAALRRKGAGLRGGTPIGTMGKLAAAAVARRQGTGGATAAAGGRPPTHPGRPLSQAARKLATSMHKGRRPDTDMALRASYQGGTPGTGQRSGTGTARTATPSVGSGGGGGGGGWSAAPTPSREWTPAVAPAVQETLEEEELRVQALMKAREKDAQQRQELDAARSAAKQAFQVQQQRPSTGGSGGGGREPAAAGGSVDLTSGLLNI